MQHTQYDIYVDGSCKLNPGVSLAYGMIVIKNNTMIYIYTTIKYNVKGTSIRAELYALYLALSYITKKKINKEKDAKINIIVDSKFAHDIYNNIIKNIKLNLDIVDKIKKLKSKKINVNWTRGHKDCYGNILIDMIIRKLYL